MRIAGKADHLKISSAGCGYTMAVARNDTLA
jgi:hypothetical protein